MKRHLSLILRFLFAAVGLAYIAFTLTWTDHVQLEPGFTLPDGQVLREPLLARVVNDPDEGEALVVDLPISLSAEFAGDENLTVPSPSLDETTYSFKPGILTTFSRAHHGLLLIGLLLVSPLYVLQTFRWWMLLRARALYVPMWNAFRLNMIGCFFNYCMPGTTGGDVIKAYYAARKAENRHDAVMTVVFDRVTGLMGLVLLAGLAGLLSLGDPLVANVTMWVWIGIGAMAVGAACYFSRRLRRRLGIEWLLARLPLGDFIRKVDVAATAFAQPGTKRVVLAAWLLSVVVHAALVTSTAIAGYALGMENVGLLTMLVVLPPIFLAAAIPLTYQGLGVMEGLGMALLLSPPDVTANQIVGMFLMARIYQIVYSLLGSVFLLRGDIDLHPPVESLDDLDEADQDVEAAPA